MLTEPCEENSKVNGNFFNIALSLAGIVLGGFSLYLFSTHDRHADTVERLNTIEARMQRNEEQLEALSFAQNEQLDKALTQIQKTQSSLAAMKRQMRATAGSVASATSVSTAVRAEESGTSNNVEGVTFKEYAIRSGDTLSKIANENGISLKRIMDANPDVVPARLQVGQVVHIPVVSSNE